MMKMLVVISAGMDEAIAECCERWPEGAMYMPVTKAQAERIAIVAENQEILAVCREEAEAAKLAQYLKSIPTQQIICLEGYEGKHYFAKCIQSLQGVEDSLLQILEMIFVPGVVNLDYYDLQQLVQGAGYFVTSFFDDGEYVKVLLDDFLRESGVRTCLVNMSGEFDLTDAMEVGEIVNRYENVLLGAIPMGDEPGKMRITVIYGV